MCYSSPYVIKTKKVNLLNLIVLAIPLFLTLIIIEVIVDWRKRSNTYQFNDAINSINLGMMSQVVGLLKKTLQFSIYALLFQNFAMYEFDSSSIYIWVFAFIAYDFCYYWSHRIDHEVNIFWASHVVHHQSEEYNLTTALRQTSGSILNFIFYLPLAIIGLDPLVIVAVGSLNLIYQFWVHTKHVKQMPDWYEYVFVTPSNHRVHHAQNPIYLDKNYGGVFILWDRLFNTYHPELSEEPVIFGITKPLASWNPLWANAEFYWNLILDAIRTKSWKDKLIIWFKPTGWRPTDMNEKHPHPTFNPYKQIKFDVSLNLVQKYYVLLQHITAIAIVLFLLINADTMSVQAIIFASSTFLFFLFSLGKFQQKSDNAYTIEFVKNGLITAIICTELANIPSPIMIGISWFSLSSFLLLLSKLPTPPQKQDQ